MPCKHKWKIDTEIGMKETPGMISRGGYNMDTYSVCEKCGKKRIRHWSSDPKEYRPKDTFTYP